MKKFLITTAILLFLSGFMTYAQVGINTQDPKSTMDIVATKTDNSTPEGIIAPRLTRAQVIAKDPQYEPPQTGAIVYVTDLSGTTTTKTIEIDKIGYYYFDGTAWQSMGGGSSGGFVPEGGDGTVISAGGTLQVAQEIIVRLEQDFNYSPDTYTGVSPNIPSDLAPLGVGLSSSVRIPYLSSVLVDNKGKYVSIEDPLFPDGKKRFNQFEVIENGTYLIDIYLISTIKFNNAVGSPRYDAAVVGVWDESGAGKWVARTTRGVYREDDVVANPVDERFNQLLSLKTAIELQAGKKYSFRFAAIHRNVVWASNGGITGSGPVSYFSIKRLK